MAGKKTTEEKPVDGPGTPRLSEVENDAIEAKCAEIAKAIGETKVTPVVMIKDDGSYERVMAFLKEPNFETELYMMDQVSKVGMMRTGNELREIIQIKEHSHPLTYGDAPECKPFKLGVVQRCITIIDIQIDVFKKK